MGQNKEKTEQPGADLQEILDAVINAVPEEVTFMGKTRKIGWLHKGTMSKCSHVNTREKNEWKRNVKMCALILLNNVWKIRLFYAVYWRWLYYVKDVGIVDVLRVLDKSKKKVPSTAYSLATILATGMSEVMMTMTRAEAKAIQAGQVGVQPTR